MCFNTAPILSSSNNGSLYIAGFAALISTISLLWNIINALLSRKSKINIDFTIHHQMVAHPLGGLSNVIPVFSLTITNVGMMTRYINSPTFTFWRGKELISKNERKFQVIDLQNTISYPIKLEVGNEHTTTTNVYNFWDKFKDQCRGNEKLWIEVTDTHKKRYKSNKLKFKELEKALRIAKAMADAN